MKRLVLSIVLAFGGLAAAQAAIKEGPVEYKAGDTVLKGSVVLEMARAGEDLRGVASFHGGLATEHPAQPDRTQARVLVMNGAEDPFVPPEQIAAFKKEMEGAKVNYKFVNYPGAKHSFTNPDADAHGTKFNLPLNYNAIADNESWIELQSFLKQIFK